MCLSSFRPCCLQIPLILPKSHKTTWLWISWGFSKTDVMRSALKINKEKANPLRAGLQRQECLCGNQFASPSSCLITAVPLAVRSWSHKGMLAQHCNELQWHMTVLSYNELQGCPLSTHNHHPSPHLNFPLTRTHLNLKALSARSVNNYRQPGKQHRNWMYSTLRYGDGQIPINQIHFTAVLLRASYVQTESNPPTEQSDARTDKVNRETDSIIQSKFTVRAACGVHDHTLSSLFYASSLTRQMSPASGAGAFLLRQFVYTCVCVCVPTEAKGGSPLH